MTGICFIDTETTGLHAEEELGASWAQVATPPWNSNDLSRALCWCPLGVPCHADALLEAANTGYPDIPAVSPASAGAACTGNSHYREFESGVI